MTDGQYPDGDPYGRGAEEVYGTGGHAAYPAYNAYDSGAYPTASAYDSGAWQTGGYDAPAAYPQQSYDSGAYPTASYDSAAAYDSGAYATGAYDSGAYSTPSYEAPSYGSGSYDSSYDTSYDSAYDASASYAVPAEYPVDPGSGAYPAYDSGAYPTASASGYETGYGQAASVPQQQTAYDTAAWSGEVMTAVQEQPAAWSQDPWAADTSGAWSSVPAADMWTGTDNRLGAEAFAEQHRNDGAATGWYDASAPVQEPAYDGFAAAWPEPQAWSDDSAGEQTVIIAGGLDSLADLGAPDGPAESDGFSGFDSGEYAAVFLTDSEADSGTGGIDDVDDPDADLAGGAAAAAAAVSISTASSRAARRKTRRSRPIAKVAGGSLAVMGAAAMAVAAAGGIQAADKQGTTDDTVASGSDIPLASPLDQQFTDLRDSAADFADRASRAQTRVALQERQEELARQQEEDRKKREQLRPKYVLPVAPGLSAYFGQAGGRWSNLHTGIDFPVSAGTPVRAVTDGVVRTEWNRSYGNMVILTAPDGTETWYCHLTRAKVVSGPVKAGDVIAYSGNSGNSTGPHLHLEVRPGGGAPINPIPWLRARGLDPT